MAEDKIEILGYSLSQDVYVTLLVTLVVFFIGLGLNTYLSYSKRRNQRLLARLNHKLFIKETNKQAIDYSNYKRQLNIDHIGNFTFQFRLIRSISVFKEFGYENTFNAYFSGIEHIFILQRQKKIKAFDALWRHIEFVVKTHEKSIADSENLVFRNAELNDLRSNSIGQAQKFIEQFLLDFDAQIDIEENHPFHTFYFNRKNIITKLRGIKNYTSPRPIYEYFHELLELNRNNPLLMKDYDKDIRSVDFNSIVLESEIRYINMKTHLESWAESYDYLSVEYHKLAFALVASYRILNSNFFWLSIKKKIVWLLKGIKYVFLPILF